MASARRTTVAAVLAVVPLALAGCGADEEPREPAADLTPDGIAAVVADHVDRGPRRIEAWDVMTRELEVEAPGAMLVYRRGTSLRVAVAPTTDSPLVCGDESFFDECVDLDHDGHRLVLAWQELEPEEDPGVVYLIDRREGEDVIADYSGVSIVGDPRDLDLGITLEEMAAIVTDRRLTLG